MINLLLITSSFIFSLLFAYIILPFFSTKIAKKGIVGKDLNKEGDIFVPEMGGLPAVLSFSFTISLLLLLNFFNLIQINYLYLSITFLVVLLVAFVGIIDDLVSIPQLSKAIAPIFFAVPLLFIIIPHDLDFHLFSYHLPFYYFFVLFGVSGAANLSNVLAGYNGLETGISSIYLFFALMFSILNGLSVPSLLIASYLGADLALFNRHKYPAAVFPGDVGTLVPGAILAVSSILGHFEVFATFLLFPHMLEFFFKLKAGLPSVVSNITKNSKIIPKKIQSSVQFLIKIIDENGLPEPKIVKTYLVLFFLWNLIVFLFFIS